MKVNAIVLAAGSGSRMKSKTKKQFMTIKGKPVIWFALNAFQKSMVDEIIFVTSLVNYIQEGYTVRAYRYLLKPINYEDLRSHLLSCISDITKKRENFMIIENKGIIYKVLINKILYIEVRKKDLTIYTEDGIYTTKNSMEKVEKELRRYNFFRCHKGYLINMEHIEIIHKNTVFINNQEIPVSKHRISNLKTKLTYILGDVLC